MTATAADPANWCPLTHEPGVFGHTLLIPACGHTLELVPPKDRLANIRWRKTLLIKAESSESFRNHLITLCAARTRRGKPSIDGLLFWLNAFGWTYIKRVVSPDGSSRAAVGHECCVPFVTWPKQDVLAREILSGIVDGHSMAVDKAREMGMSWLILAVFQWLWQFFPFMDFMHISRDESLVDKAHDPSTLFGKHDFLMKRQPDWLLPRYRRTHLSLINVSNGSTIIGKSTTGKQGHGGRLTAMLIDEAARIDALRELWNGAADTTDCRIVNSTAFGASFFHQILTSGKVKVLDFPWWEHPEKGHGRRIQLNPEGEPQIVSDWYLRRCAEAVDPREIAESLDRDHAGAGYVFFDAKSIQRHKAVYAAPHLTTGELKVPDDITLERDLAAKSAERVTFEPGAGRNSWKVWELPRKDRTYVIGADVSHGLSASNSTLLVGCKETGEVVAEFANATLSPDEFARVTAAAGLFWGGDKGYAFVVPERNGPGGIYIKQLVKLGYPWIYRHMDESADRGQQMDDLGWHSSRQSKIDLLGWLRGAIARDEIICKSEQCLMEAMSYVYYESGGVGPAALVAESAAATATHGDRVIGLALLVHGMRWVHRSKSPAVRPPEGSPAYRRMLEERRGPRR